MGSGRRNRGVETAWWGGLRRPFRACVPGEQRLELLSVDRCFDAPPSEQSSVDGPPARPQHRKTCGNGSYQQARHWMFVNSQNLRDLDYGDDDASQRRPQAHDEEKPRQGERRGAECDAQRWLVPHLEARTYKEDRTHDAAHQQQTDAGPTAGECRVKPSQHTPDPIIGSGPRGANPLRGGRCDSLGS
jgi:hypothetical protein